jgi:methyl-accepting chemotaxis protein
VQQAAQGTQAVSSNISEVKSTAVATGSAAEKVLGAAGGLARQATQLRGEVDAFLANVETA